MSTNIQVLPGKVGISNTSPTHTLDIGSNVYVDDTADNKLTVDGKIYTTDITVASNLTVMGTTTVVNTENLSIKDPIIELARDSIGTGDTGILMKRAANESNVAVFYDEGVGFKIAHTMSGANGTQITVDTANALPINLYGNVTVTSNLEVGTANLFVDTTTGNVGVGTNSPGFSLDVHGTSNVGALTATSVSGNGSSLTSLNASNISTGTLNKDRLPGTLNNTTIEDASSAFLTIHDSAGDNQAAVIYKTTSFTWKAGLHGQSSVGDFKISKDDFGSNDYFVIDTNGDVGIGADTPAYKLDVHGTANVGTLTTTSVSGDGSGLTSLNASNISTGTLGTARIPNLDAGKITTGTLTMPISTTTGTFSGAVTTGNILYVGTNTNNETAKTIYFGGTYGDNGYDHCVIERRVWEASSEKQELLLFSGNDGETVSGPDRIRLKGAQILFDTLNDSTDRTTENTKMIIRADGDVGIGTTSPAYKLDVHGTANVGTLTTTSVSGDGSGLTSLNATNISSGTLGTARIPNLDAGKITTGTLTRPISTTTGTFSGDVRIPTLSTAAIGKITPVYARGTGNNNNANRLVKIGDTTHVNTSGRGLTLTIINASTHAHVSSTNYDTYGSTTASNNLATALEAMTDAQIGILTSVDAHEGAMTANLITAALKLGLTRLAASSGATARHPYAAIFYGPGASGVSGNHALEVMKSTDASGAYATLSTFLVDDSFIGQTLTNALYSGAAEVTTPAVIVDRNGNVGIGTTSPSYKLDVHGTSNVGALTATSVSGNGSSLTSLNATNISTGTLGTARIPNLDAGKITTGTLTMPISTTTGTFSGVVTCSNVLKLEAGSTTGDSSVEDTNKTNTYIRFGEAGTGSDWAYLRQIGGSNLIKLALDFHDDNEARFEIRKVNSSAGSGSGEVVTTVFSVDDGAVSATSFSGSGSSLTSLNATNISSGTLGTARIPNLDAGKITTGTLDNARIPNLDAGKITTGTLTRPISTTTGTFSGIVGTGPTDGIIIPYGTTAQQPTGVTGMLRFNTSLGKLQVYDGTNWVTIGYTTATGGTVTYAGGYTIHTFTTSGTFTVYSAGDIELLVVAGGGGGGSGGGGAGGMITASKSVTTGTYAITVGPGGTGGGGGSSGGKDDPTSGNDSTALGYTADGGGRGGGGSISGRVGSDGGSGGGHGYDINTTTRTSGTSGQGNGGGRASRSSLGGAGGGGGAGGAGNDGFEIYGGNGGIGAQSSITGTATYYAGGGGGGLNQNDNVTYARPSGQTYGGFGGQGGGGTGTTYGYASGGTTVYASPGTDNTGGGGGGTDPELDTGGDGGDGIVIIRYLT
jgi:hypothetical protein